MKNLFTLSMLLLPSQIASGIPEPDNTLYGKVTSSGAAPIGDVSGLLVEAKALNPDNSPGATVASYALGTHPEAEATDFAVRVRVDNGSPERPNAVGRGDKFALFVEGQQVSDIFTTGGAGSVSSLYRHVDIDLEPGFDFFRWGDISCPLDGVAGADDASFILQFTVGNPVDFACVNDMIQEGSFLPAGDVNGDDVMGVLDASLILRRGIGLFEYFPVDTNQSSFGPDLTLQQPLARFAGTTTPGGSLLLATGAPDEVTGVATLPLSIQGADDVSGWHVTLTWDHTSLELVDVTSGYPSATNTSTDGELRLAGVSVNPLTGDFELGEILFSPTPTASGPVPVIIRLTGTSLDDGTKTITSATSGAVVLPVINNVPGWVVY